ncbi:MAG: acyl-CoA dehydrogenase [Anaerolineae bacterium]|nr:acyl-CoA dehydrogenase [Anaerolineae bacterium]NIN98583.1 acyl-CoA dehydrogenase [Anaerolineae bacterium]NIQ81467.1 acyl-CoA dehydrogenase [Anaerolineae bacterium]
MISLSLTEEQQALRQLARQFGENEIAPLAAEYDREARHPLPIIEKAHGLGFMNMTVPESYGGAGLGMIETCLVTEELAAACAGIGTAIMANTLALTPLLIAATAEQMQRFVGPFCAEPNLAALCMTEPQAGSDVGAITTVARRDGDRYVLNGTKTLIDNGGVAQLYSVFASTDLDQGVRGIAAFVVPADLAGVSAGKQEDKMGQRAINTSEVIFEEVAIPVENRLGEEGEGFQIFLETLNRNKPWIAAASVGVARAALEAATKYAQEREQFGRPIASFQAIQLKLANMAIKIEAARLLTWQAAWLADQELRHARQSAIAKCYASDIAMEVTTDAVQVFGGYGYVKEYPVEKYMRDAKAFQIYTGTNEIQRYLIAQDLLD